MQGGVVEVDEAEDADGAEAGDALLRALHEPHQQEVARAHRSGAVGHHTCDGGRPLRVDRARQVQLPCMHSQMCRRLRYRRDEADDGQAVASAVMAHRRVHA